jgi:hypothetical protein
MKPLSRRRLLGGAALASAAWLTGCTFGRSGPDASAELLAWPAKDKWPAKFHEAAPTVQEAYRYAVANPDVMRYMPCFCGCGAQGHTSNLDCYVADLRQDGSVVLDPMSFG